MFSESNKNKYLSVIVSVFNEEKVLQKFYDAIKPCLEQTGKTYELIFVNDGSTDSSMEIIRMLSENDSNIRAISFSRNFGHEAAMLAGIDNACGSYIICMDADLQHPVRFIPEMISSFEKGSDVINMIRTKNHDAGVIKNITSNMFYSMINGMSNSSLEKNASDFFGISGRVADVLRSDYREKVRFIRGYIQNVGFKKDRIEYEADDRAGGKSKYSIGKLFRFSMDTIICFSDAPLKFGIYAGLFAIIIGIIMAIYTIITWIREGAPNGYATIVVLICFMFGVLFLLVGIIGMYISVLFKEIKGRPVYIIEEML
ncbi:MAG: glycosyltransferase family 2 protein [Lachnospiraceae bacterium]|nr:glycosyltransferase family 2 protein [Candidatus Darwinimomas equi]